MSALQVIMVLFRSKLIGQRMVFVLFVSSYGLSSCILSVLFRILDISGHRLSPGASSCITNWPVGTTLIAQCGSFGIRNDRILLCVLFESNSHSILLHSLSILALYHWTLFVLL